MSDTPRLPLLSIKDVTKTYAARRSIRDTMARVDRRVTALDGVSFEVGENEVLGIVGESGSGKTTVARCLVRLDSPDAGSIRFDGVDVGSAGPAELRRIRREMQIIYQDPYSSLNPRLTIRRAISEPAIVHGLVGKREAGALVGDLLEKVGLPSTVANLRPGALSGGQRQRVAVARALALRPRLVIADEAVSALDVSVQAQILNLFNELIKEFRLSMVFISHQLSVISHLSDRVAVMYLGRIMETGPTSEVFANPRHPYTQALLRAHPETDRPKAQAPAVSGEMPSNLAVPPGCRFHTRCPHVIAACRDVDPPATMVAPDHHACCHVLPSAGDDALIATNP